MTESNCHPRITKPMFYHLTNGAIGGEGVSRTHNARGGGFTVHWGYQFSYFSIKLGSTGWDRTTDTLINSQLQLPLCYCGINLVAEGGIEPPSEAYETSELPLLYPAINFGDS